MPSLVARWCWLVLVLWTTPGWAGDSASNGIHGGYVGSDRWFASMRQSAANQAAVAALGIRRTAGNSARIPDDYVEFAGALRFPEGNPFPKGRFPDLRIVARNPQADPAERAPAIDEAGSFYTVLKKGEIYDLYWMYYFGSREKFATVQIRTDGPAQQAAVLHYVPPPPEPPAVARYSTAPPAQQTSPYVPPVSDGGYKRPTVGPGYQPPGSNR